MLVFRLLLYFFLVHMSLLHTNRYHRHMATLITMIYCVTAPMFLLSSFAIQITWINLVPKLYVTQMVGCCCCFLCRLDFVVCFWLLFLIAWMIYGLEGSKTRLNGFDFKDAWRLAIVWYSLYRCDKEIWVINLITHHLWWISSTYHCLSGEYVTLSKWWPCFVPV